MPPSASSAYQALNNFNSSRPSGTDYINKANDQYGITGLNQGVQNLQSLVGNLTNAAAAVAPSVAGLTSGTFTTQAQRDALTAKRQAPIVANLGQQQQALGQQQTAQGNAESMANQMASGLMNQDQQKYQSLLDQYNAANAADQFHQTQAAAAQQAKAAQALQQQQLTEQIREFNHPQPTAANNNSSALASELAALGLGQTQNQGAQMQQRKGGGFNFQGSNGQAISAAEYSQLKGIPFRTLLQQMAKSGDAGAKTALDYVGNDYGVNKPKLGTNAGAANALNALLWGVNSVKAAPGKAAPKPVSSSGLTPLSMGVI